MEGNNIILLFDNLKETYKIDINIIEKIFNDFEQKGIIEFEHLSALTEFVVQKKVSCKGKRKSSQKFLYKECEQEAIDYYAKDNMDFEEKYSHLILHTTHAYNADDYSHGYNRY